MMKKLLIVDDEKMIRQGLKAMIEREYPAVYTIGLAGNGQEALELFRREPADIIITDIRMPVMDGITLLEHLSAEVLPDRRPAVIILSGHDDFEYAKSAIRHRVKDYLLKPIRREELFGTLEQIQQERQAQESGASRQALETENYRKELRTARLQRLLQQQDVQLAPEQLEELGRLQLPYMVGVINYYYSDGTRMNSGEVQGLLERLTGPLEQQFSEILTDWEGKLILAGGRAEAFLNLYRIAETKEIKGLLMGVSETTGNPEDFQECYKQACRALQYTFLTPQSGYMDYGSIRADRLSFPLPEEELRKLLNMLGTEREKEIKSLLGNIFQTEHLQHLDLAYVENVARSINERVLDEVFRVHGEASVEVLKLYRTVGNLYNYRHFHDYYRALEHLLLSVNDYIIGIRSAHTEHADMEAALAYIEEHYARPLNMAMVSNHVSLSYSYFSEAFKAYTGESFVIYLKKVRIRHAKELLAGSRMMKLSGVSEAVGFENSKQFTRVFKELEGISPGEYRIKLLGAGSIRPEDKELY
ncbi:response regulator [Paenibacillus sp. PastF-1]|uniref:response regulator transcription factor n=1 Tax=unclassified Paenibacillus TaxID=185978 RepID=UPI00247EC3D0|nr:two-component system response regulator YesN [Paenibacillus sp. PastF-2]MDF9850045.1 two-component system response regulator YesN [Paenibacillus sp. PastM-2]MDF9856753.1 two-component system response regulator YesN [Paenibacillus sp. PastF-1]MDH6482023.1 two-component system response regulator YesN [Paenibacillus sp. PastH-2]MDH6509447.1 two-component system response regulator YesN [Paenibacillus sp. PastM-3]